MCSLAAERLSNKFFSFIAPMGEKEKLIGYIQTECWISQQNTLRVHDKNAINVSK